MQIVFFQNPEDPQKLASLIINDGETVQKYVDAGVIGRTTKYVVRPYAFTETADLEQMVMHTVGLDMLEFNDASNPTNVVVNVDALRAKYVDKLRYMRNSCMDKLDILQMRAIATKNDDVLAEVEADKQALRDITSSVDLSKISTITDALHLIPPQLLIDYDEKYRGRL